MDWNSDKSASKIPIDLHSQMSSSAETQFQETRKVALERDGNRCSECNAAGPLDVHHVIPRFLGGSDHPSNLTTLCDGCHAARHPNLQMRLARRLIERWALRLARFLDKQGEIPENVEAIRAALQRLGKTKFRDGQFEIIRRAMQGESLLVIRATGSGKSLCFQVPGLLTRRLVVVVTPTKALMQDHVAGLTKLGIPTTFLNSDIGGFEKKLRLQMIREGAIKFLFLAPERFDPELLADSSEAEFLSSLQPSLLVIDEAHVVDKWATFRESYTRVGAIRKGLGSPPVLAFTATAGLDVAEAIRSIIGIQEMHTVRSEVDRKNIALARSDLYADGMRIKLVLRKMKSLGGRTMIFAPTVKVGKEIAQAFKQQGNSVPFYHSNLPLLEREEILGRFTGRLEPELNAVICTSAFGLGIDVGNVRLVVHWCHPESVEDYWQEIGRAGRDGRRSEALVFSRKNDIGLRDFMAKVTADSAGHLSNEEHQRKLARSRQEIQTLNALVRARARCFREGLLAHLNVRETMRKSLALRILDWLFGRRQRIESHPACCDHCSSDLRRSLYLGSPRSYI